MGRIHPMSSREEKEKPKIQMLHCTQNLINTYVYVPPWFLTPEKEYGAVRLVSHEGSLRTRYSKPHHESLRMVRGGRLYGALVFKAAPCKQNCAPVPVPRVEDRRTSPLPFFHLRPTLGTAKVFRQVQSLVSNIAKNGLQEHPHRPHRNYTRFHDSPEPSRSQ